MGCGSPANGRRLVAPQLPRHALGLREEHRTETLSAQRVPRPTYARTPRHGDLCAERPEIRRDYPARVLRRDVQLSEGLRNARSLVPLCTSGSCPVTQYATNLRSPD